MTLNRTFVLAAAAGVALVASPSMHARHKPTPADTFNEAQHCRINDTVDYGCFQAKQTRFELFVLQDESPWLPKYIVGEALVKYYDAMHVSSEGEKAVRAKVEIYDKGVATLSKSELGQLDDCKDEGNPDACLTSRYCFKEAYIKVKNILVANHPEKFEPEIRWFDKEIKGNCEGTMGM
jgi:hypothetical protein